MVRTSVKRRISTPDPIQDEQDIEDVVNPSTLKTAVEAFAYAGPSTRSSNKRVKVEVKAEVKTENTSPKTSHPTPKKATAAPDAKTVIASPSPKKPSKPIQMDLSIPHAAPKNWEKVYGMIKEMRKNVVAPVDTMGCASAMLEETDQKTRRFGTLISLMLSSQTKDAVTTQAVANLRSSLGQLTVDNLIQADDKVISDAIGKVGFWRRKTGYIKQAAQMLKDRFDSEVPKTVDELCSLPGVGPKMAFLLLQTAWNINIGIGVDVHVHRITNRLGWHRPPTSTPEQTRLNLQSWLPKELHPEINPLLVGFGQMICLPIGPKCDECTLSAGKLCPSARLTSPRKRKTVAAKVEETVQSTVAPTPKKGFDDSGVAGDLIEDVRGSPKLKIEMEETKSPAPTSTSVKIET